MSACAICQDDQADENRKTARLECGHAFHASCLICIDPENTLCPICRHPFKVGCDLMEMVSVEEGREIMQDLRAGVDQAIEEGLVCASTRSDVQKLLELRKRMAQCPSLPMFVNTRKLLCYLANKLRQERDDREMSIQLMRENQIPPAFDGNLAIGLAQIAMGFNAFN